MSLTSQLRATIREHDLIPPGTRLMIAVSGGIDSMALLHSLLSISENLDIKLAACHLDHRIRGAESRKDAEFVRNTCERLKVPCLTGRSNVPLLAKRKGISIEMAARESRQKFFKRAVRKLDCSAVATAHHADDQAETFILRLARGAGTDGLGCMEYSACQGTLQVVRPFLDITRAEISRYTRSNGIAWREDQTNTDVSMLRNSVRHEVLPILESRLNPRIRKALNRTSDIIRSEADWINRIAEDELAKCLVLPDTHDSWTSALSCSRLRELHVACARRVIAAWLLKEGYTPSKTGFDTIERILKTAMNTRGRKAVAMPGNTEIRRTGKTIVLLADRQKKSAFKIPLNAPGLTLIPETGIVIEIWMAEGTVKERPLRPGVFPVRASFSAKIWRGRRIYARSWKPGDRISPFGIQGTRKLQDIFTDLKVPLNERHSIPVLECGKEIIWIPGYRISRKWQVRAGEQRALQMKVSEKK